MYYKDFDTENVFEESFDVDPNLERRITMLQDLLEERYRCKFNLVIVQGARTDKSNEEYYQKKYGEEWKRYYRQSSLHVVKPETGMMLRAVDIGFETEDRRRITGQEIYRVIQENYLFGNVGIADYYVHVDVLIRTWKYMI